MQATQNSRRPEDSHRPVSRRLAAPLALVLAISLAGCGVFGGKDKPKTPTLGNRIPILSRIDTSAKVDPLLATVSVIVPPAAAKESAASKLTITPNEDRRRSRLFITFNLTREIKPWQGTSFIDKIAKESPGRRARGCLDFVRSP